MAKGLGASLVPGEKGPKNPAESTQIGTLDQTLGPDPVRVHLSESGEVERIGRYEVTGVLGRGGMGVVYEVADREARQILALKTIETRFLALSESNADGRFRQEITVLSRLTHPGIVRLFDSGIARHPLGYDLAYFVMERLDGETLDREIKSGKHLSLADALGIVRQLGEALDYLQQNGVLHRDIKPANVFREIGGRVVLMDFGLARSSEFTRLTLAGQIVGTCAYMSPERLTGKTFEIAADVYAVGIVLYQMVVGSQPFTGTTATDMLESIKRGLPIPPRITEQSPDGQLEALLRALLAYKAEDRPTPRGVVERVDAFLEGLVPSADDTMESDPRVLGAPISRSRDYPRVATPPPEEVSAPMGIIEKRSAGLKRPLDPTRAQRNADPVGFDRSSAGVQGGEAGPTWSFVGLLLALGTSFAFVVGVILGRVTATPEPLLVPVKTIVEVPAKTPALAPSPTPVPTPARAEGEPPGLRSKMEEPPTPTPPEERTPRPTKIFTRRTEALNYARRAMADKQFEDALPVLLSLRDKNPFDPETQRLLGDTYAGAGKSEKAIACYRTAKQFEKNAELQEQLQDKIEALEHPRGP